MYVRFLCFNRGLTKTFPENVGGNGFSRETNRREERSNCWCGGTDLGSLGDLVAEDLALYVTEVCVQRY